MLCAMYHYDYNRGYPLHHSVVVPCNVRQTFFIASDYFCTLIITFYSIPAVVCDAKPLLAHSSSRPSYCKQHTCVDTWETGDADRSSVGSKV